MNETIASILALFAGIPLGLVYFGGLWWTVQKMGIVRQPALLFLASFAVRLGIALGGFYLVSFGHWNRLVFCLVGFVASRTIMIHLLVPALEKRLRLRKEGRHES